MKVMAPVSTVEAAKSFAKMGVGEIYVGVEGLEHHNMKNVTFTGRSKMLSGGGLTQLRSFEELKEVVNICHASGTKVNFTANVRSISGKLNDYFIEYIEKALEQGIDSLIVGSMAGLILINERKYGVPIHSSTFFYPFNKYNVDFFKDLGVKRVIMPTALSLEEIAEVKRYIEDNDYDIEMEVFAQFGCSNINGRCNIFHEPPSICRGKFLVRDHDLNIVETGDNFLDAGKDCTICSLKALMDIGVDSVKIMGRGMPLQYVQFLVSLYNEAIDKIKQGADVKEVRKDLLKKSPWWEQTYCKDERCLYRDTNVAKFYV